MSVEEYLVGVGDVFKPCVFILETVSVKMKGVIQIDSQVDNLAHITVKEYKVLYLIRR